MNLNNRTSGIVGMTAAGVWLAGLFIEYKFDLFPPGNGSGLYYLDQAMFFLAMAGYLVMLFGLWNSKAAGKASLEESRWDASSRRFPPCWLPKSSNS